MTDTENTIAPELLNDERALRLSKREDYIARGVNPYPETSLRSTPTLRRAKTPRTS